MACNCEKTDPEPAPAKVEEEDEEEEEDEADKGEASDASVWPCGLCGGWCSDVPPSMPPVCFKICKKREWNDKKEKVAKRDKKMSQTQDHMRKIAAFFQPNQNQPSIHRTCRFCAKSIPLFWAAARFVSSS